MTEPTRQRIVVASMNPVKQQAALAGFQQALPDVAFEVSGANVGSAVSDQPMSDSETLRGAIHRAMRARETVSEADYWVGIEGGIEKLDNQMFAFAWVVVESKQQTGRSRSGTFLLPPSVQTLVDAGQELGHANDIVFGQHNSKQQGGAIGLLSHDVIGRQQLYEHAVILALVPFVSAPLFPVPANS